MSTALQSAGGVFVQSPGGVRLTMPLETQVIDAVSYVVTAGPGCTVTAKSIIVCDGSNHNVVTPYFHRITQPASSYFANITGATNDNPVVLTVDADPTASLTRVPLFGNLTVDNVVGMSELNGRTFQCEALTPTTLTLLGEDGTNHGEYVSGGDVTHTNTAQMAQGFEPAQWFDPNTLLTVDVYGRTTAGCVGPWYSALDATLTPYTPPFYVSLGGNFEFISEGPGGFCDTHFPEITQGFDFDYRQLA